ncbi:MAG: putative transcriptional regulator YvhJ [Syntrophomonadaceae bacterium]|nr:putative transcriptional regulator YvhJ [Bacillota bacterium]
MIIEKAVFFLRRGRRFAFALILLGGLSAVSWGYSVWLRIYDNPETPPTSNPSQEKNITNILLLGLDQLGNESSRADTIMVTSVNEDTGSISLISIPRDARVEIPGRGLGKINHVMSYKGGILQMKSTVEGLLGVPLQHYVFTNFNGFASLVDILGGVEVDVPCRMVHLSANRPINIRAGRQRLSGDQALQYVRYRSDAEGDFGRMRRQQEFLKLVSVELLRPRTLLKLPRLLEEAASHIRTDMSLLQLLAFSRRAARLNLEEVVTVTLPGENINVNSVSYVKLDEAVLQETVRRYLLWEEESISHTSSQQ